MIFEARPIDRGGEMITSKPKSCVFSFSKGLRREEPRSAVEQPRQRRGAIELTIKTKQKQL